MFEAVNLIDPTEDEEAGRSRSANVSHKDGQYVSVEAESQRSTTDRSQCPELCKLDERIHHLGPLVGLLSIKSLEFF